MRLTKIYTKVGDKGSTYLANGQTVAKTSPRIEAYGSVDETNAWLGFIADLLTKENGFESVCKQIKCIQNEMFDIGAELSTPLETLDTSKQQVICEENIKRLEKEMDEFNESLPPLENFVLPGGNLANSSTHLARTTCRRAERQICKLKETENIRPEPLIYINRLSDWLFILGRVISKEMGSEEILWKQNK